MKITILTMFPEVFNSINSYPLIARAINRGNLELKIVDINFVEYRSKVFESISLLRELRYGAKESNEAI